MQLEPHVHAFLTYTAQIAYACVVYEGPNVPSNDVTCATALASGIIGVRIGIILGFSLN